MTTTITLGGVAFQAFEVPDKIPFGGEQMIAVHKLIGGQKKVDALGRDDLALEWTGHFTGSDGLSRARTIDAMRVKGAAVDLTWSELSYSVVIKRFVVDYADFLLGYTISCEVVADQASPTTSAESPSLDDQMADDMSTASGLGAQIGDATLSGQLSSLSTAVSAVSDFANATQSVLTAVLAPLSAAQGQVSALIGSAQAVLTADLGATPASIVTGLLGQATAAASLPNLYAVGSVLSRMASNVAAAGQGGSTETLVGGDLSVLASQVYGDASAWTTIARANTLTDPVLQGINTLVIPPTPDDFGGVLTP